MSAPPPDPTLARHLVIAALLEGLWITAGLVLFLLTEQVFWVLGFALTGSLALGVWLVLRTRTRYSNIVQGGPR